MRPLIAAFVITHLASPVWADDIATMPTANQLKAGEVEAAGYYIALDTPAQAPKSVTLATLAVGLSDRVELDGYWEDVDKDKQAVILTGYVRLLHESPRLPDLVVGCKNMNGASTTNAPRIS